MVKLKIFSIYLFIILIFTTIGWFAHTAYTLPRSSNNPIAIVKPTPLAKYSIENLAKTDIKPGTITIGRVIKENTKFTSYEFSMQFSPDFSANLKTTSGLINIPKGEDPFPVIVMFRGYVDPTKYFTGVGTRASGEFFAENGFITIAPDFLGYASSDKESNDIFEARFQTYTTSITLLKTVETLKGNPLKMESNYINIDTNNIFIWAHSNGGQIALTTLETSGTTYPTVLWAPVSKPFPYSILYYTDDASDSGKFLRQKTAEFENNYDSELFSLTKYLKNIKAPIQLNQGTADDAVPVAWSNLLAKNLKDATVSAEYIKYPGADHNMNPNWGKAVQNALDFYTKHIQ